MVGNCYVYPMNDKICVYLSSSDNSGDKATCKDIRSTIVRYMNLAWILSLTNLSKKVNQRFLIPVIDEKKNIILRNIKPNQPQIITVRQRLEKINSDLVVKKFLIN